MTFMIIISGVIIFITFFFLLIKWFYVYFKYNRHLKSIPSPPLLPILGCALDFPSNDVILDTFYRYLKTYGTTVKLFIGSEMRLLTGDPELIAFILSSNKILDKINDYRFLVPWLGNGLITCAAEKWKHNRKMLTPAFHFKIMNNFLDIFESAGDILIEKLNSEVGKDSFDVSTHTQLYALDVICESAMGKSVNAQTNPTSKYVLAVHNMCHIAMDRLTNPLKQNNWSFMLFKNYWRQKRVLKVLHGQTDSVINDRIKDGLQDTIKTDDCGIKTKQAFLDLLLSYRSNGEPLSFENIREEVDNFMFAGHDAVSIAMIFILFILSKHQDVQKKVLEELKSVLQTEDKTPTYIDLQKMKYLEMVIKESLRMYPPIPLIGRQIMEDTKYKDITLPAGLGIFMLLDWLHKNPNIYENPDLFIPERFDYDNQEIKSQFVFLPFSAGPRNCIGQKFAMLELKVIICKIIRNFKILPAIPEHHPKLVIETSMKSKNGVKIRLEKRKLY